MACMDLLKNRTWTNAALQKGVNWKTETVMLVPEMGRALWGAENHNDGKYHLP